MCRFVLLWIVVLTALSGCAMGRLVAADKDEVVLFNGKDFGGWTAVISIPQLKLEDIWSVAPGGVLVCKGSRPDKARGYIRTTRDDCRGRRRPDGRCTAQRTLRDPPSALASCRSAR